jgi:hypothetical protein
MVNRAGELWVLTRPPFAFGYFPSLCDGWFFPEVLSLADWLQTGMRGLSSPNHIKLLLPALYILLERWEVDQAKVLDREIGEDG